MMRDYFAEFLLNPSTPRVSPRVRPPVPRLGQVKHLGNTSRPFSIRHHMTWAIVATAIGLGSWKASRWFASQDFSKQQAEG
jgi:hypothetical protein